MGITPTNKTQSFRINGRLPGLNEIIAEARKNRYLSAKQKKQYTGTCAWQSRHLVAIRYARFDFTWHEVNRRRDPDNIAAGRKFIFDGLVNAGILKNDGWQQIAGWTDRFVVSDDPGVMVVIEEVK